jgi:hypothetical protein
MAKRPKRFYEGEEVESGSRIDAEAITPSANYGDYIPQSSSETTKAAAKPAPKPTPFVRRVGREEAESSISKAAEPSSVRKLSREEGESIKKASAPAKPDVTKMSANERTKQNIEDTKQNIKENLASARAGSGKTDTRSVNERIRSSIRSTFGFAKGGKVSSASSRADGIATKGKTRGRMC